MTQTRDLIKKMADFFTGEEYYEKGKDARLELSPDDVRCMNGVIKACGNAISRQAAIDAIRKDVMGGLNYEGILTRLPPVNPQKCDKCEVGNPCLYCKHEFEPQERSDKE